MHIFGKEKIIRDFNIPLEELYKTVKVRPGWPIERTAYVEISIKKIENDLGIIVVPSGSGKGWESLPMYITPRYDYASLPGNRILPNQEKLMSDIMDNTSGNR